MCSYSVSFGLTFPFPTKMFHRCMFQMHINFLSETVVKRRNNRFCRVTGLYIFHLAVTGIYCMSCILFFLPVFFRRIWMKKSWRTAVCVYIYNIIETKVSIQWRSNLDSFLSSGVTFLPLHCPGFTNSESSP